MAYQLEKDPNVISYFKNDHLDFEIPYEFSGVMRARRQSSLTNLLQHIIKGQGSALSNKAPLQKT